jgi:hypothetical protein
VEKVIIFAKFFAKSYTMQKIAFSRNLIVVTILAVLVLSSIQFFSHSFSAGSVSIATDKSSYAGTATITVTGTVSPAPGSPGTNIAVTITGPTGATVDANQFAVSATGTYSGTFTTGGPNYAGSGTYTASANYNGATASTLFQYNPNSKSVTVIFQTNKSQYSGTQRIFIGGLVSPPPTKVSNVAVTIKGPTGQSVDANLFKVMVNYGTFTGSFVTGGAGYSVSGTYTIIVNYNGVTYSHTFTYLI